MKVAEKVADRFAEFTVDVRFKDIPPETVSVVKVLSLKCIAGMVAGSAVASSKKVIRYVRERAGRPEAGVIGCRFRTSMEDAALADGYFAHASELEDDQFPGGGVSTITVIPALLPVAEALKLSGREYIEAALVGIEVQNRLAYYASAGSDSLGIVGLPFYGIFGATAACAKAMGLDYDETRRALGVAMTQGLGYMHQWGTDTHFWESATVCRNGVEVATLAKAGMTSNPDVERWLGMLFGPGKVEVEKITAGLGRPPFFAHNVWIKKYPCCFFTHRYIDAVASLMRENGLSYEQIEAVQLHIGPLDTVCDRPHPTNTEDSKFSFQHTLAAMMLEGDIGLETFGEGKIKDPRYGEARAKVRTVIEEDWPRRYQSGVALVEMGLRDGRRLSREMEQPIGSPKLPLTDEQLQGLYRKYSTPVLSSQQIEHTMEMILAIEEAPDLLDLMEALTFR